ncbi:MAG: ABC transporter ATP-binding protein [Porphyromonas sp.]|nr:ABC transporter ATP-binding protein [Porphyromonas sp.]
MLELRQLTIGYETPLIKEGNAELHEGELIALVGRNGSGKSTLLRHLAGRLNPSKGEVLVQGRSLATLSLSERAKLISVVTPYRRDLPHLTAFEVVALGRAPYTNYFGRLRTSDESAVVKALSDTGMSHYADRMIGKMSDGEQQRVMIAKALAQDTPIILMDEPTAFLDLSNRYELALLLKRLSVLEQKLILFSTHDLDVAFQLCHHIMLIRSPQLITMSADNMRHSGYIEELFSSTNVHFDAVSGQVKLEL